MDDESDCEQKIDDCESSHKNLSLLLQLRSSGHKYHHHREYR